MSKKAIFQKELKKLTEIFADVEESKRKLVEGLIEEAAFLKSENEILKTNLSEIGMVNIHPQHKQLQKPVEAAKQYLKNVNSYAVIIKTLNGVLNKNILEDEDELSDFE
jgi:regulator of replication initiation timing